ncbi:protein of unknown function [Methylacidimicrobium sp. AP8]|uniref:hypothetical protein n=1 Tax=Methylacidimicrobium sp. AP8 TaxID=2730359 RepID=UPI0018C02C7F|nr:hypothetical protein [Methylacidimicrobium sp. AP8]CAB4243228.1 protein of unknown function [Methylacidimicrobium sp. AP8]
MSGNTFSGNRGESERDKPPKEAKSGNKAFYWVVALASLFFLYLFYSVLNHDTVNIHGH